MVELGKRASAYSIEEIEQILDQVDWRAVFDDRMAFASGKRVAVFTDATHEILDSGSGFLDEDAVGVLGYLSCWGGREDVDAEECAEGWAREVEDGEYEVYEEHGEHKPGDRIDSYDVLYAALEADESGHDEVLGLVVLCMAETREETRGGHA